METEARFFDRLSETCFEELPPFPSRGFCTFFGLFPDVPPKFAVRFRHNKELKVVLTVFLTRLDAIEPPRTDTRVEDLGTREDDTNVKVEDLLSERDEADPPETRAGRGSRLESYICLSTSSFSFSPFLPAANAEEYLAVNSSQLAQQMPPPRVK